MLSESGEVLELEFRSSLLRIEFLTNLSASLIAMGVVLRCFELSKQGRNDEVSL